MYQYCIEIYTVPIEKKLRAYVLEEQRDKSETQKKNQQNQNQKRKEVHNHTTDLSEIDIIENQSIEKDLNTIPIIQNSSSLFDKSSGSAVFDKSSGSAVFDKSSGVFDKSSGVFDKYSEEEKARKETTMDPFIKNMNHTYKNEEIPTESMKYELYNFIQNKNTHFATY